MNEEFSHAIKSKLRPYYRAMQNLAVRIKIAYGKTIRLLHRPPMPDLAKGVFVNIGCGMTNHPDFINVDGYPHRHVHYVHRIDRLPMFADDSVDLIYASHCLEHFKYSRIDEVLKEWVRVLKPGGTLRLSVPDFDRLLSIYNETGNPDDIVEQVMGGQDNQYNFHYVLFNKTNLTNHLLGVGCTDICEWIPGGEKLTTFNDFSVYLKNVGDKSFEVSLNLEAKKSLAGRD